MVLFAEYAANPHHLVCRNPLNGIESRIGIGASSVVAGKNKSLSTMSALFDSRQTKDVTSIETDGRLTISVSRDDSCSCGCDRRGSSLFRAQSKFMNG